MLYLLFSIGGIDRFAFPAREIVEVLPLLEFRALPQAPAGIAGLFDYHGKAVPVVDLSLLLTGSPAPQVMTTRLAIAKYGSNANEQHLLGLVAEHLTDTINADEAQFQPAGVDPPGAEYLDKVVSRSGEMIQRINLAELLPKEVRDSLFQQAAEAL